MLGEVLGGSGNGTRGDGTEGAKGPGKGKSRTGKQGRRTEKNKRERSPCPGKRRDINTVAGPTGSMPMCTAQMAGG